MSDKAKLNVIVQTMLSDRTATALITGYADKSGNPELNAKISSARANTVKRYLISRGIGAKRLLVNYLGDSFSNSENEADRKVEIGILQN
jgi:outer membrane protein OmpA-like peptidoglycan-associated protein